MFRFQTHVAFVGTLVMLMSAIVSSFVIDFGNETVNNNFELYLIPAGYAFIIWPIIYVLFVGFGWFLVEKRNIAIVQSLALPTILVAITHPYYFFATAVEDDLQVLLAFIVMWSALWWLAIRLRFAADIIKDNSWRTTVPVMLHFGWITAAFPTAITQFLLGNSYIQLSPEYDVTVAIALLLIFSIIVISLLHQRLITNWFLVAFGWGVAAAIFRNLTISEEYIIPILGLIALTTVVTYSFTKGIRFDYGQ